MEIIKDRFIAHKFGGSSVANAERFTEVKKILSGKDEVIVVSAIKGTTNKLQAMLDMAATGNDWHAELTSLEEAHHGLIKQLLPANSQTTLWETIARDFKILGDILNTVTQIGNYSTDIQQFVQGYGELWSAQVLAAYLGTTTRCIFLDASKVLYSFVKDGIVCVDWERSEAALKEFLKDKDFDQIVVTGFVAANKDGKRTTLGRNGSDYSGAIFASLFNTKELIIWTDVDGIYSAHPAKVKSAFCIDNLSYKEALELAYFGASVLHPLTIAPAEAKNIPIYIKNSYNPTARGTFISSTSTADGHPVKGLSYIDDIAVINVEGAGMAGVSGTAARIFQIMQECNVSVVLTSQASSEHSVCLAVAKKSAAVALAALNENLKFEIEAGQINRVTADTECAILAAVGDAMVGTHGVAGKFFDTLAKANINIIAIAQGSSERNISAVIKSKDINKALQAVHSGFYLSNQTISIGLIGPGNIGGTLLNQIAEARENIRKRYKVDLCVRGIMSNHKMLLSDDALANGWQQNFADSNTPPDMDQFSAHLLGDDVPHAVIIDCTASPKVAKEYLKFFEQGLSVITPNKYTNAGDLDFYHQVKAASAGKGTHYLYEATVCAGLPIINTLQDLIKTGDEIVTIEGVVSGTLSYVFNELGKGRKFSDIVKEAKELGYTEPDPREDLSGQDVARKWVCLSREIGRDLSLSDVAVTNLVPEELKDCSVEEFLRRLPEFDGPIMEMAAKAKANNEKLSYAGKIDEHGKVAVAIQSVPASHPLARLNGTDNIMIFQTTRYDSTRPMVIQGPGAGAAVTAGGVFADLLRLTSYLY